MLLMTFASLRWGAVTALTRWDLDLEKRTVPVSRQFMTVRGGIEVGPLMTLATAERRITSPWQNVHRCRPFD